MPFLKIYASWSNVTWLLSTDIACHHWKWIILPYNSWVTKWCRMVQHWIRKYFYWNCQQPKCLRLGSHRSVLGLLRLRCNRNYCRGNKRALYKEHAGLGHDFYIDGYFSLYYDEFFVLFIIKSHRNISVRRRSSDFWLQVFSYVCFYYQDVCMYFYFWVD